MGDLSLIPSIQATSSSIYCSLTGPEDIPAATARVSIRQDHAGSEARKERVASAGREPLSLQDSSRPWARKLNADPSVTRGQTDKSLNFGPLFY